MSITINGSTNTITAASGLGITGNTAVTGTLSATGTLSSTGSSERWFTAVGANPRFDLDGARDWAIQSVDADGRLRFYDQTNGAEIVSINTTGLAVTGQISATTGARFTGGTQIQITNAESTTGFQIIGADGGANYIGTMGASEPLVIRTNSAERARVTDTGLAVTGLFDISNASSGQIKFPATQNASADANTLDDYEEGTWTPAFSSAAGSGLTYSDQTGRYTKIGRQVTCLFDLQLSALGTASGAVILTGLPFTRDASGAIGDVVVPFRALLTVAAYEIGGYVNSSAATATLYMTDAAQTTNTALDVSDLSATTRLAGRLTYFV